MPSTLILVFLVAVTILCWRFRYVGQRPRNYPPGPPCLPILGNLHQMPSKDMHKQFTIWAQQYGPVYSLILGTKTLIVLSSAQAVKDLLDKRSAIYSDRMDMYVGQTLVSGGLRLVMMRYGPTWRMIRRLNHQLLNINVARSYVPYQDLENKQMINELLDKPTQFQRHIQRYSNSLTTTMVFGWRQPDSNDPVMAKLFETVEAMTIIVQKMSSSLADFFPFLRNFPDALLPIQREAKKHHREEKELYLDYWMRAKRQIQDGTANPCFCVDMERHQRKDGFSDDLAAYISGTLLEAGSDTTSSTLYGFVQAMLLFPDVQASAQAEVDRVVGPDRLPTMEDEPQLQYIRSCVKESLRWMPVTPTGAIPHAVIQDDEYLGYCIPKGAGVINNVWGIHMDPVRYPQPRKFDPDRYKDDFMNAADSAGQADAEQRDHFGFGAGRRICQGMHVAERSLFLGIARILWAFNIRPVLDSDGKPKLPDPDKLTQGFVAMPVPYEASITPRSEKRAQFIRDTWEKAQQELDPATGQWKKIPEGMALPSL